MEDRGKIQGRRKDKPLSRSLFLVRSDVKQGKKKHYFRKRRWFFIGQTKTGEYQVNRVRVGYRQPPYVLQAILGLFNGQVANFSIIPQSEPTRGEQAPNAPPRSKSFRATRSQGSRLARWCLFFFVSDPRGAGLWGFLAARARPFRPGILKTNTGIDSPAPCSGGGGGGLVFR